MLIFADSFDHYTDLSTKWDDPGTDCAVRTAGQARTGIGCVQITSAAFGPRKALNHITDILVASAWYSSTNGDVFRIQNLDGGLTTTCIKLVCMPDRSLQVQRNIGTVLGASAQGIVNFNTYNSIAIRCTISQTQGTVSVYCNGVLVISANNVDTSLPDFPNLHYANSFQLMGPGGLPTCYHDDVYVLDCSASPNAGYLGAVKIYASVPTANGSVAWTPNAGTNWSNVSEIPPDGDTSFNSSSTVGQVDQYSYPATGVPVNASILAIQHCQDLRVDVGSRSVTSDVGGAVGTPDHALTINYVIYSWPYDANPGTGQAWLAGDFPVFAGPAVTA